MITENLSEVEIRLTDFFTNTVDPKDMAKAIRQINYILALNVMKEKGALEIGNLENGFYWLNELAEILDPYLDVE